MEEGEVDNDTWRQEAVRMQQENPELTTSEIAEKLQKPVKTVKNALANARKKGLLNFEKASEKATDTSKIPSLPYRIVQFPAKVLGLWQHARSAAGSWLLKRNPY